MIGEPDGIARIRSFFGSDGERSQSLSRLPGTKIDERLLVPDRGQPFRLRLKERKMRHGVLCCPREDYADGEKSAQAHKDEEPGPA